MPTPALQTTSDFKGDHLSPKMFGAKGDGITDDTIALNALWAAAITYQQPVRLPGATYKVSKQGTAILPWDGNAHGYVFQLTSPIVIEGAGNFLLDVSDANVANLFLFQNISAVYIKGISVTGSGTETAQTLYGGAAVVFDRCTECWAESINTSGCRGNTLFFNCLGGGVVGSFSKVPVSNFAGSHFASYGSSGVTIRDCVGYGGTSDGDIVHFGQGTGVLAGIGNRTLNCQIYNYAFGDPTRTIGVTTSQGLLLDSGQNLGEIADCYAYGYYYGIDIKTTGEGNIARTNTIEKCKVGIAVRRGEGNAPTYNTELVANIIRPLGGNGNSLTTEFGGLTATVGYYIQDGVGTTINGGRVEASYLFGPGEQDYIPIYAVNTNYSQINSANDGLNIENVKLMNEMNIGGIYTYTRNASIIVAGQAANPFLRGKISKCVFKLYSGSNALATPVQASYANQFSLDGCDFSAYVGQYQCTSFSNTTQLRIRGNSFPGQPGYIVLNACGDVTVDDNQFAVEGRNLNTALPVPIIYANSVATLVVDSNIMSQGSAVDNGRMVDSSGSGNGSLVVTNNNMALQIFLADWYSWNGTANSTAQNVSQSGNILNGRLTIGSVLNTRTWALRAFSGNWVIDGVTGPALAAATSQLVLVGDSLPAYGKILFVNFSIVQTFSASGLTAMAVTLGDAGASTGAYYTVDPFNLLSSGALDFQDRSSAYASSFQTGSNIQVGITANQNLNSGGMVGAFTVTVGWINMSQPNFAV
jgi:hypothetical protein